MSPDRDIVLGRYVLHEEIAGGGMASVHLGRLRGAVGFSRTVAIKRLLPQFARDPEFVAMFVDEARLAARVRHPNVIGIIDVVAQDGELFLVMEYVAGAPLGTLLGLLRKGEHVMPIEVATSIVLDTLYGLAAAHAATSPLGEPLQIVHRDISPQNLLVGVDGVTRVLDFGIAKAASRLQETRDGRLKGKLAYMSPEQLARGVVDQRSDVYATSVVFWEAVTGERLFFGDSPGDIVDAIRGGAPPPSSVRAGLPAKIDEILERGLTRDPEDRFARAEVMAHAVEQALPRATPAEVAAWVKETASELLDARARLVATVERAASEGAADEVPFSPGGGGEPRVPSADVRARAAAATLPLLDEGALVPDEPPRVAQSAPASTNAGRNLRMALVVAGALGVIGWIALRPSVQSNEEGRPTPSVFEGLGSSASDLPVAEAPPAATPPRPSPTAPAASVTGSAGSPRTSNERPPTGSPSKPPRPGCNPPYTLDEHGVKRFIARCL